MSNSVTESSELPIESAPTASPAGKLRTQADFQSLLLELARAERGYRYFRDPDRRRGPLVDRVHRALQIDLERSGALDFTIGDEGFRLQRADSPKSSVVGTEGALEELRSALRRQGLERLRLDPSLTLTALDGFLDLLVRPGGEEPDPDRFSRLLAARDTRGLQINEIDAHQTPEPPPRLAATPPRAAVSIASTLPAVEMPPAIQTASTDDAKPCLEDEPLSVVSPDDRGERLRARLIELDATVEEEAYRRRAADIVVWAEELWHCELHDDCYRALLVLADHAVGAGGRSEDQARAAEACFGMLAMGDRLTDLIDRATRPGLAGVRAAQLLLQLGEPAVPAILGRLCDEDDPDRAAPLRALILTQGETALAGLLDAIRGKDERRARVGIQLAGELQNPVVLPALLAGLRSSALPRRIETIRALSLLPGEESQAALMNALTSDLEEIASEAGKALASVGGSEAVPAFLDVLESSIQAHRTTLGCTLIELLGRLRDERAVPRLSAILERRPMLRRAHWHSIQIAALEALSRMPAKEARRAVDRAARYAHRVVADRARQLIAERGANAQPVPANPT
jgi:HEAT repeat protein